jgi:hypothetical protein
MCRFDHYLPLPGLQAGERMTWAAGWIEASDTGPSEAALEGGDDFGRFLGQRSGLGGGLFVRRFQFVELPL